MKNTKSIIKIKEKIKNKNMPFSFSFVTKETILNELRKSNPKKACQIFWNIVVNFNMIWIWQLKKYLQSITQRPIHVLFAPKSALQKVDSPDISAVNIT